MAETISKRRYGGVDPVERRSARRDRLIEAAIGLYGRQGYRNTGVRAVCQEAGLTERYFYESFVNSEALLAAAYDAVVARLLDALREAGGDDAPPVTLRAARMLESYFSTIRAQRARVPDRDHRRLDESFVNSEALPLAAAYDAVAWRELLDAVATSRRHERARRRPRHRRPARSSWRRRRRTPRLAAR
ncbi:TetR/AcrR family transcriptional regulator [Sphingomonas sp.]|uniref:TetR/AcrR family transcriptional regulator n=1 Tax=Sphingomonas sp. TaxID=28214 RepID=UPI003AFFE0F3